MKKFTLFFAALMMSVAGVSAADAAVYTVSAANGKNQNYAGNCDIVSNGITWNVQGNTTMEGQYGIGGWGLGGKSITNQDRAIYSKDAINADIKQVKVTHNANNGITINSFAMIISDASNSAGDTVRATADDINAMADKGAVVTFTIPEGKTWNNKYYKFLYNLTNTETKNKRIEFVKAEFFDEVSNIPATAIALDQTTLELERYKYTKITATLTPADATTAVTWTSSDEKVATVSAKGTVTAVSIGTATITATAGELTATCTVTVKEATPITCAQAVEIAKTVKTNNTAADGGKYVIRGYVTALVGTPSDDMKTYGNYSVWMADTKDGGKVFEAFRAVPIDGKTIAAVGDYVEVVGDITIYNTAHQSVAGSTIKVIENEGTAVEDIKAETGKAVKVIENGQLIIIRDNVRYNAVGTVIE